MLNRFFWQYIFAFIFIVWVFVSYPIYNDFLANFIRFLGFCLLLVGVIGRLWATIFIGGMKNEGVDGKSFVDYGAYSLCRNPLYFFSFLAFLGLLALKAQLLLILIGALFFLLIYRFVIKSEEAFLLEKFQHKYKEFLQKVPRFFPSAPPRKSFYCPESITMKPEFFHRELKRSLNWFLGGFALLGLELLHAFELLPNLFYLY